MQGQKSSMNQQTYFESAYEVLTPPHTRRKRHDLLRRLTALLTAFVLLQTMVWIPQPAAAEASPDWICGLAEHTHGDDCYTLVTDHEETEAVTELVQVLDCDFRPHKHNDDCYLDNKLICGMSTEYFHVHSAKCYETDSDGNKTLVCTLKENRAHEHEDACYTETKTLSCGMEAGEGAHKHTDDCYKTVKGSNPVCGQKETDAHKHDESCYTDKLTCGKEETDGHQHSDKCYETRVGCGIEQGAGTHHHDESCYTETTELICENIDPDHEHTDDCYKTTQTLICEKEETDGHQHSESCNVQVLVCGKEQGEGAHHHDASCYTKELTCGKTEGEGAHKHTDACYPDEQVLVCDQKESKGHKHSDDCYTIEKELTCKYAKVHEHTRDCYHINEANGRKVYTCGYVEIKEHKHTDSCWSEQEVVLVPAHIHTDECYTKELTCEIPEHVHTEDCLAKEEPTVEPTAEPTEAPTEEPTAEPTEVPTEEPTAEPSEVPTEEPTAEATDEPAAEPTPAVTEAPVESPSAEPTEEAEPILPVVTPEPEPATPTDLDEEPTEVPTFDPAAEPTEEPSVEPIAEPDTEDVLRVSGADYVIRLYAPVGTFPENATLSAQELDADSYTADIIERLDIYQNELEFLRVFDLTIRDAEGESFEPTAQVRVEIEMETAGEAIRILHYRNEAPKQSVMRRTLQRAVAPAVDVIEPEASGRTISFTTDSFSTYAIAGYTVDFHYDGFTYSIPGETSIALSELFTILGIEENAADAVEVVFSDETLVQVDPIEDDWLLTSLKSFQTEETLTITMANGRVYVIAVTDAMGDVTEPWYIDDDGTLHIHSDEAMDFVDASRAPWYSRRSEITKIVVEDGVTKIPQNFVAGTSYTNLTDVEIADSVTSMGTQAFYYCPALKNVSLGKGITSLPNKTFYNCTSLASIEIPASVTSIGTDVFYNCGKLEEVVFDEDNQMTSLPSGLFQNQRLTSLKTVVLPGNLESISNNQFNGCTSLSSVEIPDSVTSIGNSAFNNCKNLASVEIPASVTSIGENAFMGCTGLEEVSFHNDNLMTSLPKGVFKNCSKLESVVLPQDLSALGDEAFSGCTALPAITFPRGLQSIGNKAFENCSSLEQADLPRYLVSIGDNAFSGCTALAEQTFPNTLTSIGAEAYKDCQSLGTITLPASVETLGQGAFRGCTALEEASLNQTGLDTIPDNLFSGCTSLSDLLMPDDYTAIGNGTFSGCTSLTSFDLPASIQTIGDSAFFKCSALRLINSMDADIVFPSTLTKIGESAFNGCSSFVSVEVPDSVNSLGASAFANCANLERAIIYASIEELPAGLFENDPKLKSVLLGKGKRIPDNMFKNCASLTEFEFWEGLEEIGSGAFQGCTNLVCSEFPSTLKKIEEYAFANCTSLDPSVTFPAALEEIGDRAFDGCNQLTDVHFKEGEQSLTIGDNVFYRISNLQQVDFSDNITSIGRYAFSGCSNAVFSPMPKSLVSIGTSAFSDCRQITELDFPASLVSIGSWAFNSTTAVTSVTFAEGSKLETIGMYAFHNQAKLKEIDIPDTVNRIEQDAFSGCSALEKVHLPELITSIQINTFNGCSSLKAIDIPDSVKSIDKYAFYNCSKLEEVEFPESLTSINSYAFSGCTALKEAILPDGVTTIGTYAFDNCQNLETVHFPEQLKSISDDAFQNCYQLQEAILPDTVTSLGSNAFSGCRELKTVRIPKGMTSINTNAFNDCYGMENLIWDVPSTALTVPALSNCAPFTLTLGKNVDSITQNTLSTLITRGADNLAFEGENYLTLPSTAGMNLPRPLNDLEAGEYFADAQGVLYLVKDGVATLVYVPDGLDTYTIPATIPGKKEGDLVHVTGVKSNALYQAQTLTALTIQSPETMKKLDSYAFAFARNLESVNGKTTQEDAEALFTNAEKGIQLFYETKLGKTTPPQDDALYYDADDPEDAVNGWSDGLKVHISEIGTSYRADAEGTIRGTPLPFAVDPVTKKYLAFTGEPVTIDITISNPESAVIQAGDKVRVYIRLDDGGSIDYAPGSYDVEIRNDQSEVIDTVKTNIVQTDVKGVYYCEFDRPSNGATLHFPVTMNFASPTTGGGNADVWAEYFTAEKAEATAGQARDPIEKRHTINWSTKRNDFELTKACATGADPLTVTVGPDYIAYVSNHSYVINLTRVGNTLQGRGRDNMASAEFVDTMILPEEIVFNPTIIKEIREKRITYSGASSTPKTISSPTYGAIFTFSYSGGSGITSYMPTLSLNDEGKPQLIWRIENKNPNRTNAATEISVPQVTVTVSDRVLQVKSESAEGTPYKITNQVRATEHFCYSPDVLLDAEATYQVNASGAKLEIQKTATNAYLGEKSPYTIRLDSTGIVPITNRELTKVYDTIDESRKMHYIDADGIWYMYTDGKYPDLLKMEIRDAILYGGEGSPELAATKQTVMTTNGGTGHTDQENTSYQTAYSGRSGTNSNYENTGYTFFFWKVDDMLHYELKKSNETIDTGVLSSANEIQAMFDKHGFYVTRDTVYYVEWDFASQEDLLIPGGTSVELYIPTRYKDSFMALTVDTEDRAFDPNSPSFYNTHSNTAYAKMNDSLKNTSAYCRPYLDITMSKGMRVVESHTHEDKYNVMTIPDVIEYTLSSTHSGETYYDVMPITDHMTLKQTLLVPVEENKNAPWVTGLAIREVEGVPYYVLNQTKTYEHVWTGDAWADKVEVKALANDTFDTLIWWYIPNYGGNKSYALHYKALLKENDWVPLQSAYYYTNETWVGDHQGHRLWDRVHGEQTIASEPIVLDWSKKIVNRVGDTSEGYDYSNVTKGKQVVYRFYFENDQKKTFTIKGDQIYDLLPDTSSSTFKWSTKNVHLTYVGIEPNDPDAWSINNTVSGRQRIEWSNDFTMTCNNPDGIGYIYVTLDFPNDQALWDNYARYYGGKVIDNTLYLKRNQLNWESYTVTHDLADHLRLRLQKGVYATGGEYNNGTAQDVDVYDAGDDARLTYSNDDTMRRKVYYYITLHNDSYTNLYLNPLQDILPPGFTFEKASVQNSSSSFATVTGEKMTPVSYVDTTDGRSTVEVTAKEKLADGRERVTLELKPDYRNQYNDRLQKYYLKPGQAMVIRVDAYTNKVEDQTPEFADNMVTTPVLDFYGQGFDIDNGTSTSTGSGKKNDGGCELIDTAQADNLGFDTSNETAVTAWLFSNVIVTKGGIQPGIVKSVAAKISIDSEGKETRVNNPITVNPTDKLIWNVTAIDSGVSSIVDYTITDVLPGPQHFSGAVSFQQIFNTSQSSARTTLFTIARRTEMVGAQTVISNQITFTPYGSTDPVTYTMGQGPVELKIQNDNQLTKAQKPQLSIWVSMEKDVASDTETLIIRLKDEELCIPVGGRVSLNYETENLTKILVNKLLVNTTFLTPLKQTWDGKASEGNIVEHSTPFDNDHTMSVRNSAQIAATYGGATTSKKKIEEVGYAENNTDSDKATNWITIPDEEHTFKYTLSVSHNYADPLKKIVLIDNLPEPGDHTVFQNDDPRGSAFKVMLDSDPQFTLTIERKEYDSATGQDVPHTYRVPETNYRIELSTRTEFIAEDWRGEDSEEDDWTTYTDSLTEEKLQSFRSVRLVFTDEAQKDNVFVKDDTMYFSFIAKIDPDETNIVNPGTIAWNSFGYHYTRQSSAIDQEAAPLVAGVRVPDYPSISKSLINARSKPYTAEQEETFEFVIYEGNVIPGIPGNNTKDQIITSIENARRNYVIVSVTVPEGKNASEVSASLDGQTGKMWNDGSYVEAPWRMKNDTLYIVVELPSEHYTVNSYNNRRATFHSFRYTLSQNEQVISSVNMHDDWSFRLNKTDQFGRPVGGAVFAIYTPVASEALPEGITLDELNEMFGVTLQSLPEMNKVDGETTYKLMTVVVLPGYGHIELDVLSGSSYLYQELSAPKHYELVNGKVDRVERNATNPRALVTVVAENKYKAAGKAQLVAGKNLYGRSLAEKEFSAEVKAFDLEKLEITDNVQPMPVATIVSNESDGSFLFKDIRLTEDDIGKTYCYQISEVIPEEESRLADVTYDETKYIAKLQVIDLGDGKVGGTVTYSYFDEQGREHTVDEAIFNNRYSFQTSVSLNVKKILTGKDWQDDDVFTFVLEGIENTETGTKDERSWTNTVGNANEKATFTISYDENYAENTWYYRLTEVIPDDATAYSKATGLEMQVPKNRTSRIQIPLTYVRYQDMPQDEKDQYGLDESDIFWKYRGLSYDWTAHEFSVRLWYDADAKEVKTELEMDGKPLNTEQAASFTNNFVADNTDISIPVRKTMEGRPLILSDKFIFVIVPDEGSPAASESEIEIERVLPGDTSQTNAFTISYKWDDLKKSDGTYASYKEFGYTIYEKIDPDKEGVEITRNPETGEITGYIYDQVHYDLHKEHVQVKLIDNGDGTMCTEVDLGTSGSGEPDSAEPEKTELSFVNRYEAELIGFPVQVNKQVNSGAVWGDRSYSFNLYDAEGQMVETLKTESGASSITAEIDAKLGEGVTVGNPKTYQYYLKEVIPGNAVGYAADGTELGKYSDATAEQQSDPSILWKLDGTTYDSSKKDITVTVTMNERDYHLRAVVKYGTSNSAVAAEFNNGYKATGEGQVKISKKLNGRDFVDGDQFTFTLSPIGGAPLRTTGGEKKTLTVEIQKGSGEEAFDTLVFDESDLHRTSEQKFSYRIHEVVPAQASVTPEGETEPLLYQNATEEQKEQYDGAWTYQGVTYAKDQTITVTVTDNGDGTLTAICNDSKPVEMENSYTPNPTETNLQVTKQIVDKDGNVLDGWKIEGMEGMDWTRLSFSFTLDAKTSSAPLPDASGRKVTVNFANQTGTFGPITFTEAGTYEYTITEILPAGMVDNYNTDKHLIYDQAEHTVRVVVTDNPDGTLSCAVYNEADEVHKPQVIQNKALMEFGKINIAKQWMFNDEPVNPGDSITSISVYLWRSGNGGDPVKINSETKKPAEAGKEAKPFVLNRNDAWKWTIEDLPNYEVVGKDLIVYTYYVEEIAVGGWQITSYTSGPDKTSTDYQQIPLQDGDSVTITNTAIPVALPLSGGYGTALYYALGILLMGLAAAGLVMEQRRKRHS